MILRHPMPTQKRATDSTASSAASSLAGVLFSSVPLHSSRSRRRLRDITFALVVAASLVTSGCATAVHKAAKAPAPSLSQLAPGDELYELSPARIQIRRLSPQSLR